MQTVALGSPITVSAMVIPSPDLPMPTGVVVFKVDGVSLGVIALDATGTATLIFNSTVLGLGIFDVIAYYPGDKHYAPSESLTATKNIVSVIPTTLNLSGPSSVLQGRTISLTTHIVHGGSISPTGTIAFSDFLANIGSISVFGDVATFPVVLPVGNYSLMATYSGDSVYGGSTSLPISVSVIVVS